jgi:hypothetical protein
MFDDPKQERPTNRGGQPLNQASGQIANWCPAQAAMGSTTSSDANVKLV